MAHVFIIQRIDHEPGDEKGNFGFTNLVSAHTTLKAANRAAKVLLYNLFRDDDDGEIAVITNEKIRGDGTYLGTYQLSDEDLDSPGTNCVTLTVIQMDVQDETWSPYEDENDEQEFVKETGGFLSDAEGDVDCVNDRKDEDEEHDSPPLKATKTTGRKNARTSSKTAADDGPKKKKAKRMTGT